MSKINYEKQDHIALITLNRPEVHNAIDLEMKDQLMEAWTDFRDDPNMWVVIVKGAGEKAFSAGVDVGCLNDRRQTRSSWSTFEDATQKPDFWGINRNLSIWKPKIAAINGYCLGGGLELALACDIRIASKTATFGFPEPGLGMLPGGGGTQRLPRIIPPGLAIEIIITGRRLSAREAHSVGLVNHVVENEDLLEFSLDMAQKICERAPLAVRASIFAVNRGLDLSLNDGLHVESMLSAILQNTRDVKEGAEAFKQKRKANFSGE